MITSGVFIPHITTVKHSSSGMAVTVVHTPGGKVVVGRTVTVLLVDGRTVIEVPLLMNI